jgi:hypothetical protein
MHKLRNVADKLPDDLAATVMKKMRAAYHAPSAIIAEAQLEALARELEHTHPGARRWCAAGRSRPANSSAVSTATCTFQHYEPPSIGMSPSRLSVPTVVVMMKPRM